MKYFLLIFCFWISFLSPSSSTAKGHEHPSLILTKASVKEIRDNINKYPILERTVLEMKKRLDATIAEGIEVPIPKDPAGGYTHEQHKENYRRMYEAGILYQVLQDPKYAQFVDDMLMKYAEMFPTLPLHPVKKSYAPGKLFWQCLNDDNWVVYTAQAYDCVYDAISPKHRKIIEKDLLRPYAEFLSKENLKVFNRIHNHGVWDVAAVGMLGYVLGDQQLVEQSLHGYFKKPLKGDEAFRQANARAGFYAHLNQLFGPEGYYTEGPYYHRYALTPFILFAEAISNNEPERDIFHYRNSVLLKTVDCLLQLTNEKGEFLPFNDAIPEMSINAPSVIEGVDIAYKHEQNPDFVAVAALQNKVTISEGGLMIAKALASGDVPRIRRHSHIIKDGQHGDQGGIGFLYSKNRAEQFALTLKYSTHGLSHGHYDKLGLTLYKKGKPVLQDYGAVRYVNVEQKEGGRYLPETAKFARQSGSHNVMTCDGKSHFDGNIKESSKHWGTLMAFDVDHKDYQAIRARQNHVYEGVDMQRTIVQIQDTSLRDPIYLDVMEGFSKETHQYDLSYQYLGQIMDMKFDQYTSHQTLSPIGTQAGFEYIWKVAEAETTTQNAQFSWLNHEVFYTITTLNNAPTKQTLGEYGANDPNFNLRREPMYMMSRRADDVRFVNLIEPHGKINPATNELVRDTHSQISDLKETNLAEGLNVVQFQHSNGHTYQVFLAANSDKAAKHTATLNNETVRWQGPISVVVK
ncbi:hypothetical protein PEPS_32150 (plasmid) [Persicobacter psychrovividus]|uniref:Alginate lyase n=2 Tax=Persicobacter psychrovividus TaxID=387638 RepID=A0ABM7VIZ9_9BACT|nr:hypothetical protein PEPS_32150 [Persicobacter psychrovividus]